MLLLNTEAYLIYETVRKTEKIPGDVAEVGVYRGGSAKLIREATKKPLHLGTATPVSGKRFSFVHLDVDIYESTLACLTFFYPRMTKGGCIISHDYPLGSDGVRRAFDEFFSDKPEIIIEPFATDQALVVKL